uniref:CSON008632 protein n=1 Tax=Culicoides sonorensis TaxID=179676 RepID=A0A336MYV0_CULSO
MSNNSSIKMANESETMNILERLPQYEWKITPTPEKNLNNVKKVKTYFYRKCNWNKFTLKEDLKYLYEQKKLFISKKIDGQKIWECKTYMEPYLISAKAPTKIEACRVATIIILKEFFHFPFDDSLELPEGEIDVEYLSDPLKSNEFAYPDLSKQINDMEKFLNKEKALNYLTSKIFVVLHASDLADHLFDSLHKFEHEGEYFLKFDLIQQRRKFKVKKNQIEMSMFNILDRLKSYEVTINPVYDKKLDEQTLNKVKAFITKKEKMEWKELDLANCLESLYDQKKLFSYKICKDYVECTTYMDSYLISAKAPTKVEACRLATIKILQVFYNLPFNDQFELPVGKIDVKCLADEITLSYPELKNSSLTEMEIFTLKERALGYLSKVYSKSAVFDSFPNMIKNVFNNEKIEYFQLADEVIIKISSVSCIFVGSKYLLYEKALELLLGIEFGENAYPENMIKVIEESCVKLQKIDNSVKQIQFDQ